MCDPVQFNYVIALLALILTSHVPLEKFRFFVDPRSFVDSLVLLGSGWRVSRNVEGKRNPSDTLASASFMLDFTMEAR